MGTTQRISPGVPHEPNWRQLNSSITQIAKTIEKEKEGNYEDVENQESQTPEEQSQQTPEQKQHASEYRVIIDSRNRHLKSAFINLVKTGGGSKNIASGKSKSIGRAGLRSSTKIVNFFAAVGNNGLQSALTEVGFNIAGKNIQDVIDYLQVYSSDSSVGMDETAANKASCEVLNELALEANNDLGKFEEIAKRLVQGKELSDLLCRFWGYYIFEHLSQRFQEKITQQKGEDVSMETFRIIKEDILWQVKKLNENRNISRIDWKGEQGKTEIEKVFQSIINILCDEN